MGTIKPQFKQAGVAAPWWYFWAVVIFELRSWRERSRGKARARAAGAGAVAVLAVLGVMAASAPGPAAAAPRPARSTAATAAHHAYAARLCTPRKAIDPPFRVQGRRIVMASGKLLLACGSVVGAPDGWPGGWAKEVAAHEATMRWLVSYWGVNTIRIMAWQKWLDDPRLNPGKPVGVAGGYKYDLDYLTAIQDEVSFALKMHVAVILQLFGSPCAVRTGKTCTASPAWRRPGSGAIKFWTIIKDTMPQIDKSAVMLDLYNEPSMTGMRHPWALWEHGGDHGHIVGMQQLADTVTGTGDLILADGLVVSQTLAMVGPDAHHIRAPPGTGGIVYVLHHPAHAAAAANASQLDRILRVDYGRAHKAYPVMFTEWSGFSSEQSTNRKSGKSYGSGTCWPHEVKGALYQHFLRRLALQHIGLVVYGTQSFQDALMTRQGQLTRITPAFHCVLGGMHPQEGAGHLLWDYFHGLLPGPPG